MKSVGIDIIEINRLTLKNEFITRYLSSQEIIEFQKLTISHLQAKFLVGRWALKEAIYKALPHEHLVFNQINIFKNEFNQPTVKIKDYEIRLSLSHNNSNIIAIAVVF